MRSGTGNGNGLLDKGGPGGIYGQVSYVQYSSTVVDAIAIAIIV